MCNETAIRGPHEQQEDGDAGYMLMAVVLLVFFMLLALSIAAPRMAQALKHDQEIETKHRAEQYVRAIRVYHRKFNTYPPSIDVLVNKTNNVRFLRQRYLDPLTGKDDWKLIHFGENKTQVKGLFGQDLGGLGGVGMGGALGSASGMASGGPSSSSSNTSFGGTTPLGSGFSSGGSSSGGTSSASSSGSPFGSSSGSTFASSGASGASGSSGSTDATNFSGGGGQIIGVGVPKQGIAMLTVNDQTNYQDWEFLYDPRIEQLLQAGALNSGNTGSGTGSGLPGASGATGATGPAFGTPSFGSNGSTGATGPISSPP